MIRKTLRNEQDRYITIRDGKYHFRRRIPSSVGTLDSRYPTIRLSLRTTDLASARAMRDVLEAADHELWAALLTEGDVDAARKGLLAARKVASALRFSWKVSPIPNCENRTHPRESPTEGIIGQTIQSTSTIQPSVSVSQAFEVYCDEIMRAEMATKSKVQKAAWKKVKQHAINNFIKVVGDKPIDEISRDDGRKFYVWWLNKIAPSTGRRTHTSSIGNRDLGNMRVLYRSYYEYVGDMDRKNPFERFAFHDQTKRKRPPFPVEWIQTKIMNREALAGMNDELRGIVLAMIETGARPSELCNLNPEAIVLQEIPHLKIMPREDPANPREIKTQSSIRNIPLIGVALEVFKQHPNGFPRYRESEGSMSAAANKYFRENNLLPSGNHKLYSLRHSFEDRMKEAGLDEELRRILMGHAIDRPRYGSGGSLEWRLRELKKIELPFDYSIL